MNKKLKYGQHIRIFSTNREIYRVSIPRSDPSHFIEIKLVTVINSGDVVCLKFIFPSIFLNALRLDVY